MPAEPIAVVLLTALHEEYLAVLQVDDGALDAAWAEAADGPNARRVARRRFTGRDGNPFTIVATWAAEMGGEDAAGMAGLLLGSYNPRCLVMSGIAAGRRGKVALGDVVFGHRLYKHDGGKQIGAGSGDARTVTLKRDPDPHRLDARWKQAVEVFKHAHAPVLAAAPWVTERPIALDRQAEWILARLLAGQDPKTHPDRRIACPAWTDALRRLRRRGWLAEDAIEFTDAGHREARRLDDDHPDGPPSEPPLRMHLGDIASGGCVIEDDRIFADLDTVMRKTVGLEMEARAIAATAHAGGVPALVVKAVCDFGDPEKDDAFHQFAARAAAECLIAFLRAHSDLFLPPDPTAGTRTGAALDQRLPGYADLPRHPTRIQHLGARYHAEGLLSREAIRAQGETPELDSLVPRTVDYRTWASHVLRTHAKPVSRRLQESTGSPEIPSDALTDHCPQGVVVRGASGTGKTMLAGQIARSLATRILSGARATAPIVVNAADAASLDGNLLRYAQNRLSAVLPQLITPATFQEQLRVGAITLIIYSLERVPLESRRGILAELNTIRLDYSNIPLFVLTQPHLSLNLAGLNEFTLLPLNLEEQVALIANQRAGGLDSARQFLQTLPEPVAAECGFPFILHYVLDTTHANDLPRNVQDVFVRWLERSITSDDPRPSSRIHREQTLMAFAAARLAGPVDGSTLLTPADSPQREKALNDLVRLGTLNQGVLSMELEHEVLLDFLVSRWISQTVPKEIRARRINEAITQRPHSRLPYFLALDLHDDEYDILWSALSNVSLRAYATALDYERVSGAYDPVRYFREVLASMDAVCDRMPSVQAWLVLDVAN